MAVRAVGVLLIIVCGGLWGIYRSAAYKRRVRLCDEIGEMISRTSILIRYNCCDVDGIVRELKAVSDIFSDVPEETADDGDMSAVLWESAADKVSDEDERQILMRFCSDLGTSDTEGQLAMLSTLKELTSELRKRRSEEYLRYGRLYRSAGLLFGLMAGIAII